MVDLLAQAAADGRLTFQEHAGRVQRAYTARTLGELAELTKDLARPDAQPFRLDTSRAVTAFFATERREGRWVVPDRLVVTAVGGQVVLDLREALLHGQRTMMYATALGGQVHLLVPAGISVRMHGMPGLAALAGGPDQADELGRPAERGLRAGAATASRLAGDRAAHADRAGPDPRVHAAAAPRRLLPLDPVGLVRGVEVHRAVRAQLP